MASRSALSSFFVFLIGAAYLLHPSSASVQLYVSQSNGSDKNNGTQADPFQTVTRARDYIRDLKSQSSLPDGGITVIISEGELLPLHAVEKVAMERY